MVGLPEDSKSIEKATNAGLKVMSIRDAARNGDMIMILVPDVPAAQVYLEQIKPALKKGKMIMFAHGFNIHFKQIKAPKNVDVTMVAPKAPGHRVRGPFRTAAAHPASSPCIRTLPATPMRWRWHMPRASAAHAQA